MSYLTAVPRALETNHPARAVTVVSPDTREVVYLDQSASIEIITEALKAWGLRVREERTGQNPQAATTPSPSETNWETTRSEAKAPTRLENVLSPLWFPVRASAAPAESPWAWFNRAA